MNGVYFYQTHDCQQMSWQQGNYLLTVVVYVAWFMSLFLQILYKFSFISLSFDYFFNNFVSLDSSQPFNMCINFIYLFGRNI